MKGFYMAYSENYINTYNKYIAQGWYGNAISSDRLERWNRNFVALPEDKFDDDPKICAHYLLHSLIYYQDKQLESIIHGIANKIISVINQKEEQRLGRRLKENELADAWEMYKKDTCIIPASNPESVSDSAHHAIRLWRNILGLETRSILELDTVVQTKQHIFFVDDMIGTGKKITSFFKEQKINTNDAGSENLYDYIKKHKDETDFNIAVFAIYCEGFNVLINNYDAINCYFGDYYNEDYDLLSNECVFFDLFDDRKEFIINYISKQLDKLEYNEEYVRNLPISFQEGCPNNTLPLYYISNSEWTNLLNEGHPDRKKRSFTNENTI